VWDELGEYEAWITTAPQTSDPKQVAPLDVKPLMVITEDSDIQEEIFSKTIPKDARLRVFGSARTVRAAQASSPSSAAERAERARRAVTTPPEQILTEKATNYRRWWNNSWAAVEEGGQAKAGDWTAADAARLKALVDHAHRMGYWIRFYTLDGFTPAADRGWDAGYNFGTQEAAAIRWKAAVDAGVNFIATDQYEDLAAVMKGNRSR
jgi:hypothetical protein